MTDTFGLCRDCYGIVPATVMENSYGVSLKKECPTHGLQENLIDPSVDFYHWVKNTPRRDMSQRVGMTALNTTNRCNVRCPGCYHLPDNSSDRSLDSLVQEAVKVSKPMIGLMGAEPTMRDDLPALVAAIVAKGKKALIYTNGIRLEEEEFVGELKKAGLDRVALSLHLPNYIGTKAFTSKIKALDNLYHAQIPLDHLAFSLKTLEDMSDVVDLILGLDYAKILNSYVRVRAPSAIGGKRNEPAHMSELLGAFVQTCTRKSLSFEVVPFTNHRYAVMLKVEDRLVMLVRWPTVDEIDLREAEHAPIKALFVPEIGETHILHHVLVIERVRSGGALPPPPPLDCPDEFKGTLGAHLA